jgi:hypothetical protein
MATIKTIIKVRHTSVEEKQITITLPCYRKRGIFLWKILSDNEVICVDVAHGTGCGIAQSHFISELSFDDQSEEITEEEFFTNYNEIKDRLYARATSL